MDVSPHGRGAPPNIHGAKRPWGELSAGRKVYKLSGVTHIQYQKPARSVRAFSHSRLPTPTLQTDTETRNNVYHGQAEA